MAVYPVLHRQSLGGLQMQARRAREWSWPMSAWHRWPKRDKCRWQERLSRTWPNHIIGNKIRPMDMEDASETPHCRTSAPPISWCPYMYGPTNTVKARRQKFWGRRTTAAEQSARWMRQQDICFTEFRRLLKTFLFAETRRFVTSLF